MHFDPPPTLQARPYAILPDTLRRTQASEWASRQPVGAPAHSLLEGPVFDPQGRFFCVDIINGRILTLGKDQQLEEFLQYDGWPNGLKFHADGRLFVADYQHGIMVVDPVSRRVEPYITRYGIEPFKGVNDLFFSSKGELFFTDQGSSGLHDYGGRVFRVSTNGRLECILDGIPSPNGIVMNRDESALLLAVTRANAIWKVPFLSDGSVTKVGNFIQMSGGGGPDGLALDEDGELVVAHVGLGVVWVFDALGQPKYRIECGGGLHVTNIAYGGPDRRQLFITEASTGQIMQVQLDVAGKKLFGC